MKIKNISNRILLIGNMALRPGEVSLELSKDIEKDPAYLTYLSKGYIKKITSKEEAEIKPTPTPKYSMPAKEPKLKQTDNGVKYVVAGEANIPDVPSDSPDYITPGINAHNPPTSIHDVIDEENLEAIIDDPSTLTEQDRMAEKEFEVKDADQEIYSDYAQVVKRNGVFGAEVKNVGEEIAKNVKEALKPIKSIQAPSENFTKFDKNPFFKKRSIISKSEDKTFLKEVSEFSQNETIKKLALQRLKELE